MQTITVTPARHGDVGDLRQLSIDTFTETFGYLYPPADLREFLTTTYSTEALGELLRSPRHAVWIARDGETPVGYVLVGPCGLPHPEVTASDGEIKRLYIRGSHQSMGLGRVLMGLGVDWLDTHCDTLWLGVWSKNFGAQRFYSRFGFSKAGEYRFKVGKQRDHEFIFRRG